MGAVQKGAVRSGGRKIMMMGVGSDWRGRWRTSMMGLERGGSCRFWTGETRESGMVVGQRDPGRRAGRTFVLKNKERRETSIAEGNRRPQRGGARMRLRAPVLVRVGPSRYLPQGTPRPSKS